MKRSDSVKEDCIKEAKQLLSLGYSPAAVALRLQRTYGFSRATSFRDVETASAEMDAETIELDADTEPAPMTERRNAMLCDLEQAWMEASAQHNVQELMQLSRAFERLYRMGGDQSHKF